MSGWQGIIHKIEILEAENKRLNAERDEYAQQWQNRRSDWQAKAESLEAERDLWKSRAESLKAILAGSDQLRDHGKYADAIEALEAENKTLRLQRDAAIEDYNRILIRDSRSLLAENANLREAAQAVINQWDSPNWKLTTHTGAIIGRLRAILAEHETMLNKCREDRLTIAGKGQK